MGNTVDLLRNPFHILAATTRDNHERIINLADERSLLLDGNECLAARLALTTPRKRLAAEVAWLPGIGPKRAEEVVSLLESCPTDMLAEDNLLPAAKANALAAALAHLPEYHGEDLAEWITELAQTFDDIDSEELKTLINEERIVAGFPEVTDITTVETEIQERRWHYRQVIKAALDNLPPKELVEAITEAVESATDIGEEYCPVLMADLVDAFEVDAQEFLDKEEANIITLVEKIRAAVDAGSSDAVLAPVVNKLVEVVKNWDIVAQPIQVCAKSRGLDHGASIRVGAMLRSFTIDLFNEHGKLDFSQQLTNMLQEVFAEVGEIAERTAEDAATLEDLAEQRTRWIKNTQKRDEEWRREITYEANVGVIFKDKLRISPEGIEWKGRRWALNSITRVRWGGTRHSVNGTPTGTTYSIIFGNGSDYASIELKKEEIFSSFIDRLWRAVCVRLLTEYLEGLRDGKKYRFGSAVMSDHGMELEHPKFFGSNERVFCRWGELEILNGAGFFCIRKKEGKKLAAVFSYQEEDNIHVLEAAIRMFLKLGGDRLSCLLEE
jgi:hypothetical protein